MKLEILQDKTLGESILIDNRYQMYQDGVIYDTEQAKDIPQWVFEFKEFVLRNNKTMAR